MIKTILKTKMMKSNPMMIKMMIVPHMTLMIKMKIINCKTQVINMINKMIKKMMA